jgi:hypothetical protein
MQFVIETVRSAIPAGRWPGRMFSEPELRRYVHLPVRPEPG